MNAPQLYLVPCSCGELLRVRSSQAGEQLACKCGATVSVPTIRGLKQLTVVVDEASQPAPPVSRWQGPIFACGVLALFVGCLVLAGSTLFPPAEMQFDATTVGQSAAAVERAKIPVSELGMDRLYDEFVELRNNGRSEQARYVHEQITLASKRQANRQLTGAVLTGVGGLLTILGLALPALLSKPM